MKIKGVAIPVVLFSFVIIAPLPLISDVTLYGDLLTLGVNEDGSFIDEDMETGLLYDPDGSQGGEEAVGDFLYPGSWKYEYFSITFPYMMHYDYTLANMAPNPYTYYSPIPFSTTDTSSGDVLSAEGAGEFSISSLSLDVWEEIKFPWSGWFIQVDVTITNTGSNTLSELRYMRGGDPDQDYNLSGSMETLNSRVEGTNFAIAMGETSGQVLGLGSTSDYADAGTADFSPDPDDFEELDDDNEPKDTTIDLLFNLGSLQSGRSVSFTFYYFLADSLEEAEDTARNMADWEADDDGDSVNELWGDCNDSNPSSYPGAEEIPYNGVDEDCDGEDLIDVDRDGFDAEEAGGNDCDDSDPAINPDAEELCGDWVDNDCNGLAEDGCDEDGGKDGGDGEAINYGQGCGCSKIVPQRRSLPSPLIALLLSIPFIIRGKRGV